MKLSLVSLALFVSLAAPAVHADTIPFTGSMQTFTITSSGTYALTAVGAQGGGDLSSNSTNIGGYGASVSGDIYLTAGTVLQVVVGGTGQAPTPVSAGGGGGGGTFIFTTGSTNPLLVAGGGGECFPTLTDKTPARARTVEDIAPAISAMPEPAGLLVRAAAAVGIPTPVAVVPAG